MTIYTQCIILSTKTVHALLLAIADNSRLQVPLCPTQGKERQVPHISPAPEAFLPLSASRVQGSWRCTLLAASLQPWSPGSRIISSPSSWHRSCSPPPSQVSLACCAFCWSIKVMFCFPRKCCLFKLLYIYIRKLALQDLCDKMSRVVAHKYILVCPPVSSSR